MYILCTAVELTIKHFNGKIVRIIFLPSSEWLDSGKLYMFKNLSF